jgi:hypothetical protein
LFFSESVAVTVKFNVPATVVLPVITPVFSAKGASEPPVTA